MTDFALFDRRNYPTLSARAGYREWVPSYENTVEDVMDLALFERIETVDWAAADRSADLACGTGRTAQWLTANGVTNIDGVDLTPEMLERARDRDLHATLSVADVRNSGLDAGAYDLVVSSLVDEHLPELTEFYAEARRLMADDAAFVQVGFHPFFIMAIGMPTHFDGDDGKSVAIETHVHLPSSHLSAARAVGLVADEMLEQVIDDEWIALKPKWERNRGWPISYAFVWRSRRPGF